MNEDYVSDPKLLVQDETSIQNARADGYLSGRFESASTIVRLETELTKQKRFIADSIEALIKEREDGPVGLLVENIVGHLEIADNLGCSLSTVRGWAERRDITHFPKPIKTLTQIHIYDMRSVQKWFVNWSSTRRERQNGTIIPKFVNSFHQWPTEDQHFYSEWQMNTGLPKPTQWRACIHPKCKDVQYREAPKG